MLRVEAECVREGKVHQGYSDQAQCSCAEGVSGLHNLLRAGHPELGGDNILPLSQCRVPASQACRAKEADLDEHMCRLRLPKCW
jgi:hypothetical protein